MTDFIQRFRKELEADPSNFSARANLGTALFQAGRREEAAAEYRKAVALEPDNAVVQYNLGNTLRELGLWEESVACCRRALALKPPKTVAVASAHCMGDCLRAQDRLAEAEEQFRFVLDLDARYGPAHYNLANTLRKLGRVDEALAQYAAALDAQHDRALGAAIHVNWGTLLEVAGRRAEAVEHYGRALELDPADKAALQNLARALAA